MAPRVDYAEDWQLQCGEIKQRGAHLLKSELWSDCSFLVGESSDQVVIKAHKLILAMASPVFEAMFYGPIAEGNGPIPIPDIQPQTFRELLEYIYTDNIELDSFDSACSLYYGAQKYMLSHLLIVCTMYLSCNLTPEVACQMYEFALMVGEESLIKECEEMIISETSSILLYKGFEEISIQTVEKIFALPNLNISSELDLFKAAERYAKALDNNEACASDTVLPTKIETEIKNVDKEESSSEKDHVNGETSNANKEEADQDKDEEVKNKNDKLPDHNYCLASTSQEKEQEIGHQSKTMIKKLVKQIRFLTLTPAELAEYPTLTSLLTETEILALMMNCASDKTHMPMPEGFSTSKTKRTEDFKFNKQS